MFSANNFYQWTYETYLKDKSFSMLTYHPFGTRGYKNLQTWDLTRTVGSLDELLETASVLMNDQEPVLLDSILNWKNEHVPKPPFNSIQLMYERRADNFFVLEQDLEKWSKEKHLYKDCVDHFTSITDNLTFVSRCMFVGELKPIIVHSELNSNDIKEISKEFIPVYVFWHGLISRDWYRHWRLNTKCNPNLDRANNDTRFLLYARAWTGSRKYRLKFVENIIKENLHTSFKYNFFELDDGEYYGEYTDVDIARYFPQTQTTKELASNYLIREILEGRNPDTDIKREQQINSNSSAYIEVNDYQQTAIQVVAETLFETDKIHLTEKTFQPIVVGQPFLTLSAPGTLQTLKHYGFKTFDTVWDEAYDSEQDHDKRMTMVVEQIKKLNSLSKEEFKQVYTKCLEVCEHNRQHFFSDQFEQQILEEYDTNFKDAFAQQQEYAKQDPGGSRYWIADETCFNCYNTEFFYDQDLNYLKYMLAKTRERSEEQYQAILEQYWWAKKLANMV